MNNTTRPEPPDLGTGISQLPEPDLDRKPRFAERAGISPRCLDNWLKQKRIPYLRVGKVILIPWREALAHLRRNYGINARGE